MRYGKSLLSLCLRWAAIHRLRVCSTLLCVALGANATGNRYDFSGSAFVDDDGVLHIHQRRVRLWGIVIPATREQCIDYIRPLECGPRAVLTLKEGITGFVRCQTIARNEDGSVSAQCFTGYGKFDDGIDLAAYLLNRGWALTAPDAPSAYQALESVARQHGLGLWGTPRAVLP
jgi:endonuclease YncB( thermonuclease family)